MLKKSVIRGALLAVLLALTACAQQPAELSLTLGGDIMLARAGEPIFVDMDGAVNPWQELESQDLLPDREEELFFANLESPLGNPAPAAGEMNLCADPSLVSLLKTGHISLVSLANNHREDCASDDEVDTRVVLNEKKLQAAGVDLIPVFTETSSGLLAVIAADDISGDLDVNTLVENVKEARVQAQFVIVSMHWGEEYQGGPTERQETLAKQLADAGADVVWGHHPHVLQRMQWLNSADGRRVLVLYSLGNLLADQWMLEDAQRSALVKLVFREGEIDKIEIIPLQMDHASRQLTVVTDPKVSNLITGRLKLEQLAETGVEITLWQTR